jgi:hypothetical protein
VIVSASAEIACTLPSGILAMPETSGPGAEATCTGAPEDEPIVAIPPEDGAARGGPPPPA